MFCLEFAFRVINEPVKVEPRDQISPYQFPGNYRDTSQATPSPQPTSPPTFLAGNNSPLPVNFLQAPNAMLNNFPLQPQYNQSYTPNIQVTSNTPQYNNGNVVSWTNNLNGIDASTSRAFNNNNMTGQPSSIFNEQLPPLQSMNPIFSVSNEPRVNSSFFMDMDSNQLINNLSGDLSSLLNLEDGSSFTRIDDMNRATNK